MTLGDLFFIVSFLAIAGLILAASVNLLLRRRPAGLRLLTIVAAWVGLYALALFGVGLASQARELPLGEDKCFDEWCIRLDSAKRESNGCHIELTASNHGRRDQRPDTPRAVLMAAGIMHPVDIDGLTNRVDGGGANRLSITLPLADVGRDGRLIITEGGGPTPIIIGDENGPLHAKSYWSLGDCH